MDYCSPMQKLLKLPKLSLTKISPISFIMVTQTKSKQSSINHKPLLEIVHNVVKHDQLIQIKLPIPLKLIIISMLIIKLSKLFQQIQPLFMCITHLFLFLIHLS